MKKLCILALSLLALPVLADNNRGFYLGIGGASIKDEQDGVNNVSRLRAVEFFGGYKYNNALGAELRIGSGQKEGTSTNYADSNGNVLSRNLVRDIDSYQSIYYKPELVNDEAKLYALIGYTHLSTSGKVTGADGATIYDIDDSASGLSYGVGVGFVVNEHFNVNFEYRNICKDISNKPNLAAVNIDYRF
ncbi:MAG: porin family protein [Gammaproteobacteria bacterium]|nr:MAG: porin family protein [Gammaproteobacteria bacterium]